MTGRSPHPDALAANRLLAGLDHEALRDLAPLLAVREIPAGETVFAEGDAGESMLFLASGGVEVVRRTPGDLRRTLAHAGAGDVVGELALVARGPRTATVRTTAPTTAWELDARAFELLRGDARPVAIELVLRIAELALRRLRGLHAAVAAALEARAGAGSAPARLRAGSPAPAAPPVTSASSTRCPRRSTCARASARASSPSRASTSAPSCARPRRSTAADDLRDPGRRRAGAPGRRAAVRHDDGRRRPARARGGVTPAGSAIGPHTASRRSQCGAMQAKVVATALAALVLAGCGSSSSSPTTPAPANAGTTTATAFRLWSLSDFLRLSGIRRSADGTNYVAPGHPECASAVILRSTAEVQSYLRSGDVVVTNPDRSAGVKVTGVSPVCQKRFAQALAKIR